jgi:hypothetical protein
MKQKYGVKRSSLINIFGPIAIGTAIMASYLTWGVRSDVMETLAGRSPDPAAKAPADPAPAKSILDRTGDMLKQVKDALTPPK